MKFIVALLILAFVSVLPLIVERAPNHCVALERLAMHKLLEPRNPANRLDPATDKRVRAFFRAGHVAEVIIARNYNVKPAVGCPLMYWLGLFDPDSLRDPVLAMQP
jgi:hypothetical protein